MDEEISLAHFAPAKIADLNANTAMSAIIEDGLFHKCPSVADFILIEKITAAIIATETDAVNASPSDDIAKGARHEMFVAGFIEDIFHFDIFYFAHSAAGGVKITAKHQAEVKPRASAKPASLAATAVADPESLMAIDNRQRLLGSADKMLMLVSIRHILTSLSGEA